MSESATRVRTGMPADLRAIVALEQAMGTAPHWPVASYAAMLDEQGAGINVGERCLFVAERTGVAQGIRITGFAVGVVRSGERQGETDAELESVAVLRSARRRGVGRALCSAVLDWCRERGATAITLEVRASSAGAIALYQELGFVRLGVRPRYYREPEEDAVLHKLSLIQFD